MNAAVSTANVAMAAWNHAPLTPSAGRRARLATGSDWLVAQTISAHRTTTVSAIALTEVTAAA